MAGDLDVYTQVAAKCTGKKPEAVTKIEREAAKAALAWVAYEGSGEPDPKEILRAFGRMLTEAKARHKNQHEVK